MCPEDKDSWKEEKKHEVRTIYNQFLKENNGNNEEILGPIAADFHLFADPQLMMSAEFWWEIQELNSYVYKCCLGNAV